MTAWPRIPPHVQETIITLIDATCRATSAKPNQLSKSTSRKISRTPTNDRLRRTLLNALRHRPEILFLRTDLNGWVDSNELLKALNESFATNVAPSPEQFVQLIQKIDSRGQFQFETERIRAAYGHSFVGFQPSTKAIPELPLFHGTDARLWPMIQSCGLLPQKRRFVQLTTDFVYAEKIANARNRHPVILQAMTTEAIAQRVQFFQTGTHVWLATTIPSDCLQL
ncbi:MAG: RNA 2'-phosphotransferase [Pirellulaceae bacterium]|nr:RNA 2'-phosphotransferase [Pirellulaceae bacterium]